MLNILPTMQRILGGNILQALNIHSMINAAPKTQSLMMYALSYVSADGKHNAATNIKP